MPQRPQDLEEYAPGHFIINNPQLYGLLKREGKITGRSFALTTWRRDGLLARLRMRGFTIWTLADALDALPPLPNVEPYGALFLITPGKGDRYSRFDEQQPGWLALAPELPAPGQPLTLQEGWVLRRRQGRGPASYAQVLPDKRGLQPLSQTQALLTGFAYAAHHNPQLPAELRDDHWHLPLLELPAPHQALLAKLAEASASGYRITAVAWPLVQALLAKLGIRA